MLKFAMLAIRADGLFYFLCNYRECLAHYAHQEHLAKESADPVRRVTIARYVDALYDAGDLR
jgi:hypothetical protein